MTAACSNHVKQAARRSHIFSVSQVLGWRFIECRAHSGVAQGLLEHQRSCRLYPVLASTALMSKLPSACRIS